MKLEKQVCSLKLAKKLKKLGVKQESYFAWAEVNQGGKEWKYQIIKNDFQTETEYISAFTVAELGEMLPDNLCSSGMDEGEWGCVYGPEEKELPDSDCGRVVGENFDHFIIEDKTEANARAKMLICLLGEK